MENESDEMIRFFILITGALSSTALFQCYNNDNALIQCTWNSTITARVQYSRSTSQATTFECTENDQMQTITYKAKSFKQFNNLFM